MDCLVIERLHLRVRGVAQYCKNLGQYEKAVNAGVLNQQSNALSVARPLPGLQGPTAPMPSNPSIQIADWLCMDGKTIAVSDVVCRGTSAGRVLACCYDNTTHGVVVDEMRVDPDASPLERKFAATGGSVQVWLLADVEPCMAWTQGEDPCVVIFW